MGDAIVYKPLGTAFKSKGFDYKQIKRVGNIAMFEQSKPGLSRTWIEVVIVQRHDGYEIAGKYAAPAETMPPTSQWGRLGWTFRHDIPAMAKFDELVAARA